MKPFDRDRVTNIAEAAIQCGLGSKERRSLLLGGLPAGVASSLPDFKIPRDQVLSDLELLSKFPHVESTEHPMRCWLVRAAYMAGPGVNVPFTRAIALIDRRPDSQRTENDGALDEDENEDEEYGPSWEDYLCSVLDFAEFERMGDMVRSGRSTAHRRKQERAAWLVGKYGDEVLSKVMRVAELREACWALDLPVSGRKADLVERLLYADFE